MADAVFDPGAIRTFRFTSCRFDAATGEARLGYAFDAMPEMVETVRYPGAPFVLDPARAEAVQRALRLLPEATAEGDVLVVADTGAYGFTMASRYNLRELPQEEVLDD
jgi:hypothetical protein